MISTIYITLRGLKAKNLFIILSLITFGEALLTPSTSVIDENNELVGDPTPLSFMEAIQLLEKNQYLKSEGEASRMISITNGGVYRGGKQS